jgi:hypothetical protein
MEAWPESNSHITDTNTIAGVENEAKDENDENEKITHKESDLILDRVI